MTKIGNNNNNNLSNFNKSAIAWFIIYIAIGLTISFIVPFPLSLIFYIGIYLLLQTHRIKSIQKRYHYSESNYDKENNKTILIQNFKEIPYMFNLETIIAYN